MSEASTHVQKQALLIGINHYPNLSSYAQLKGCVNDVRLMQQVLEDRFSFPAANIDTLTDEAATREKILSALEALYARTGEGAIVVVHYAGHGSQMTDREGDEPDGFDSTLVPYDSGRRRHPNRDITDDEIYAWLLKITDRTPYVTLIFDCCHSGTITRDVAGEAARSVEPDTRPIAELPPSPVAPAVTRGLEEERGRSGWLPIGQRYVLLAACRDEEKAYEYTDPESDTRHGTMTYFLSQALAKAGSATTYRDLYEQMLPSVRTHSSRQHPQLEGTRDRLIFGTRELAPMRFVRVLERDGGTVRLAAGAALGMTKDSVWTIYPPGTRQVDDTTPALGRVEVTAVGAVTATARIAEESAEGAIASGSRAVEAEHMYGAMQLVVAVEGPPERAGELDRMRDVLGASPLLRLPEDGEAPAVQVYLVAPRTAEEAAAGPVPQLAAVEAPLWAATGRDGLLAMPPLPARQPDALLRIRDNLEKEARFDSALALENNDPRNPLAGKIEMVLKQQRPDGTWGKAEPEETGSEVVYREGERLAVTITNHWERPVYLHLLDFGLTKGISLLYPVEGANEPLAPGRALDIGIREGDELYLYLPDNYPFVADPADVAADVLGGLEVLKLFATSHEADFSSLLQGGTRHAGSRGASPLDDLLAMALTGTGTRDVRRQPRAQPGQAWTTVSRAFWLRRA